MDYRKDSPQILLDFLSYQDTVQGHSLNTVEEYYLDLRSFLRYCKQKKQLVPEGTPFDEISIRDINLDFVKQIALSDIYDYLAYLSQEKRLNNASRARKVSAIRSFYKFLFNKTHQLESNPAQDLESPKQMKSLPRYLTLDESIQLLEAVDEPNKERDYCILMLFLNCGLRISELVGLNIGDIRGETIRVLGKGNKERILYLNEGCKLAIEDYKVVRSGLTLIDKNAFFVSERRRTRLTRAGVHKMIKKRLLQAGLDTTQYSAHKLRHTAATLMLQNGVDVRTLQEVLGHDHLNTTQIYTHVDNASLRTAARANPLAQHMPDSKASPNGDDKLSNE